MLHINTLFKNNSLVLWLPSISDNKADEKTYRFYGSPKFIITLVDVLKNLDKSYTYMLRFSLFLHTKDPNIALTFLLSSECDWDLSGPKDEVLRVMLGMRLLYWMYDYRGYRVFHYNKLDLALVKDLDKFAHHILEILGKQVIYINENISEEGFIEFKKPVLLKITRSDKSGYLGLSKKESVSNSCVDISSNRRLNWKKIFGPSYEQRSFYSTVRGYEKFNESIENNNTPLKVALPFLLNR